MAQEPRRPSAKAGPTPDEIAARARELEAQVADLKKQADLLREVQALDELAAAAERARVDWNREAFLRIEIRAGETAPLVVAEVDPGSKPAGRVETADLEMVKRFLIRTRKDPTGPKRLLVVCEREAHVKRVQAVLDVVKAAGFDGFVKQEVNRFPDKKYGAVPPFQPAAYVIEPPDVLQVVLGFSGPLPAGANRTPLQTAWTEHLVRPDGTVMLAPYGVVAVTGKTLDEAREAIRKQLADLPPP